LAFAEDKKGEKTKKKRGKGLTSPFFSPCLKMGNNPGKGQGENQTRGKEIILLEPDEEAEKKRE